MDFKPTLFSLVSTSFMMPQAMKLLHLYFGMYGVTVAVVL